VAAALIVPPICTEVPFKAGTDLSESRVAEEVQSMRMTTAVNALGLPAVAVPVGVEDGLPQAVQAIGSENFIIGSDYPHPPSTFPTTAAGIEAMQGLSEQDKANILGGDSAPPPPHEIRDERGEARHTQDSAERGARRQGQNGLCGDGLRSVPGPAEGVHTRRLAST